MLDGYLLCFFRAEFRLHLRPDNADLRLTQKGIDVGCVGDERRRRFSEFKRRFEETVHHLRQDVRPAKEWKEMFGFAMQKGRSGNDMSAFHLLSVFSYGVSGADLADAYIAENGLHGDPKEFTAELAGVCGRVKTEALYERPVALQG